MPNSSRQKADRQKSLWAGRLGEWAAVCRLWLTGWRVIARNFRVPQGEIDIIARRGRTLAYIEVKQRAHMEAAAEAIQPRQWQRIVRAAEAYIQKHPQHGSSDQRFDAMLVVPWRLPVHIRDAWRP